MCEKEHDCLEWLMGELPEGKVGAALIVFGAGIERRYATLVLDRDYFEEHVREKGKRAEVGRKLMDAIRIGLGWFYPEYGGPEGTVDNGHRWVKDVGGLRSPGYWVPV